MAMQNFPQVDIAFAYFHRQSLATIPKAKDNHEKSNQVRWHHRYVIHGNVHPGFEQQARQPVSQFLHG